MTFAITVRPVELRPLLECSAWHFQSAADRRMLSADWKCGVGRRLTAALSPLLPLPERLWSLESLTFV